MDCLPHFFTHYYWNEYYETKDWQKFWFLLLKAYYNLISHYIFPYKNLESLHLYLWGVIYQKHSELITMWSQQKTEASQNGIHRPRTNQYAQNSTNSWTGRIFRIDMKRHRNTYIWIIFFNTCMQLKSNENVYIHFTNRQERFSLLDGAYPITYQRLAYTIKRRVIEVRIALCIWSGNLHYFEQTLIKDLEVERMFKYIGSLIFVRE